MESVRKFGHQAMGALFEISFDGEDPDYVAGAAETVFARIDTIETALSRHRDDSDLNRVNRTTPGDWVLVSPDLQQCLLRCFDLYRMTEGLFNPAFRTPGALEALQVDDETPRVRPRRAIDLDLGGIGKGFALDECARLLREDWDLTRVLLHGGGSTVLAMEAPADRDGWRVGAGAGRSLLLRNRAISASGTAVRGEHIIDTRTGRPAAGTGRVWSLAPDGTQADGLSTAFFLMDPAGIRAFCLAHPEIGAQWMVEDRLERAGSWPADEVKPSITPVPP